MKHPISIVLITLILLVTASFSNNLYAAETDTSSINSFEDDVTGDGLREQIKIKGHLLSENSSFYQNVWIDIESPFKKQWSISLQNGYDPQLKLIDLNHDEVFDLFYQVKTENASDTFNYQFYTLKAGKVTSLPLPKRLYIEGKFIDDFKVNIQLDPHKKPETIDMAHKKAAYIESGIYDSNGTLKEKPQIEFDSISKLEPVLISKSKGYGVKSTQQVKGIDEDDHLGKLETLWRLKKEKWIIIKSTFHSLDE